MNEQIPQEGSSRPDHFDMGQVDATGASKVGRILPLFPLPDMVLFPGQIQPLHVFEPRYLQMIADLLDTKGEFVIGTVLGSDKLQLESVAPVQSVAGLGRIEQYQELPDGRFFMIALGLQRVRVTPLAEQCAYPTCLAEPILEDQEKIIDPNARATYETLLRRALMENWEQDSPPPEKIPLFQLTDLVQMHLTLTPEQSYDIYSTNPLEKRIRTVLEAARA